MTEFVVAYAKDTGVLHRVPDYFLDHPVLGKNLRKTPLPGKASGDINKETHNAS